MSDTPPQLPIGTVLRRKSGSLWKVGGISERYGVSYYRLIRVDRPPLQYRHLQRGVKGWRTSLVRVRRLDEMLQRPIWRREYDTLPFLTTDPGL